MNRLFLGWISLFAVCFLIGVNKLPAQDIELPAEELTWNIEDYVDGSGSTWTTARFETLRGARYHLQSSPDLESWAQLQSFYALGEELHLALFEKLPGESSSTESGELPQTTESPTPVSFYFNSYYTGSGVTGVTWSSLSESSPDELIFKTLNAELVSEWGERPFYAGLLEPYLVFAIGLHSFSEGAEETSSLEPEDQAVWDFLQANFATIQQQVVEEASLDRPVPAPPHPDSRRFYRLERTFPDSDGDGLTDYEEFLSQTLDPNGEGTDPFADNGEDEDDFDGDGIPNEIEEELGFNLWSAFGDEGYEPELDRDGDRVSDVEEYLAGTDYESEEAYPPRLTLIRRWIEFDTPPVFHANWDGELEQEWDPEEGSEEIEEDFVSAMVFPDTIPTVAAEEAPDFHFPRGTSFSDVVVDQESLLVHGRIWLERKPATEEGVKMSFLKVTEEFTNAGDEEPAQTSVDVLELEIEPNETASQAAEEKDLIPSSAADGGMVKVSLLPVEFITPAGDPVEQPKDAGDGQNEFTFNAAMPGVLEVSLKVRVPGIGELPEEIQNRFTFGLDAIGNSQMEWDAANPGGKPTFDGDFMTATAKFTSLPQNNSDFGKKMTWLNLDAEKLLEEDFEVFYTGTARNHHEQQSPNFSYPNWFVFYKQNAGGGEFSYHNENQTTSLPGRGDAFIQIGNDAYIENGNSFFKTGQEGGSLRLIEENGGLSSFYTSFLGVLAHERHHANNEIQDPNLDSDGDFLSSDFETNTSNTDPNNSHSADGVEVHDDSEVYANGPIEKAAIDAADTSQDWANPGSNYGKNE